MMLIITEGRNVQKTQELVYRVYDIQLNNEYHFISFVYPGYLGHLPTTRDVGVFYKCTL